MAKEFPKLSCKILKPVERRPESVLAECADASRIWMGQRNARTHRGYGWDTGPRITRARRAAASHHPSCGKYPTCGGLILRAESRWNSITLWFRTEFRQFLALRPTLER